MAAAIGVRADHAAVDLRQLARRCVKPDQVRRLLAMLRKAGERTL